MLSWAAHGLELDGRREELLFALCTGEELGGRDPGRPQPALGEVGTSGP